MNVIDLNQACPELVGSEAGPKGQRTADWLVDLGPDGGVRGGEIVAEGTPEEVARVERSYTGAYLRPTLEPVRETVE